MRTVFYQPVRCLLHFFFFLKQHYSLFLNLNLLHLSPPRVTVLHNQLPVSHHKHVQRIHFKVILPIVSSRISVLSCLVLLARFRELLSSEPSCAKIGEHQFLRIEVIGLSWNLRNEHISPSRQTCACFRLGFHNPMCNRVA